MARTYRLSMTAVVIVCLLTSTVAASEPEGSSSAAASSESVPAIDVGESIADVAAVPDRTHATRGLFSFDARALHFDGQASPATRFVDKTAPFRFSAGQIVQGHHPYHPYPNPYPSPYHVRHDGSIAAPSRRSARPCYHGYWPRSAGLCQAIRPQMRASVHTCAGGCGRRWHEVSTGGARCWLAGSAFGLFVGAVTAVADRARGPSGGARSQRRSLERRSAGSVVLVLWLDYAWPCRRRCLCACRLNLAPGHRHLPSGEQNCRACVG